MDLLRCLLALHCTSTHGPCNKVRVGTCAHDCLLSHKISTYMGTYKSFKERKIRKLVQTQVQIQKRFARKFYTRLDTSAKNYTQVRMCAQVKCRNNVYVRICSWLWWVKSCAYGHICTCAHAHDFSGKTMHICVCVETHTS